MIDFPTFEDDAARNKIRKKIDIYEADYRSKYGKLPVWKTIDDILKTKEEIEKGLEE